MENPYLSIVVTTRNDNHGGDLLKRTILFVEGIYHQAKKFQLNIELIIGEWNPPLDKALLKDVLPKPPEKSPVVLRYIIVPQEIHNQYRMAERMPLFQMTAKNVGIRRAKAPFILCTNIDLLFSDELFSFLKSNKLKKNHYFRANRVDVSSGVLEKSNFVEQINYAKKNIIAVLGKQIGNEYLFGTPRHFYAFKNSMKVLNLIYKFVLRIIYKKAEFTLFALDTSACGDFTLMHADDWNKIEGYPELDLYSIHIDSMALVAASALNIKQVILSPKACSYHIYHTDGWESFKENPVELIRFIEKRPGLDWYSVYESGKYLLKNQKTWGLNNPNWGFVNESFKEYIFESGKEMKEFN